MTLIVEIVMALGLMGALISFMAIFSFTWSWAQQRELAPRHLTEILSLAAVEWAAWVLSGISQALRIKDHHEAPPLKSLEATPQQIPVIFVPSLHTRSGIFFLIQRLLKAQFFNSLWFFDWRFFLKDAALMEDELLTFIREVLKKTDSPRFRILSFGSARPIVARALKSPQLAAYCDQWISISGPLELSSFQKLLLTTRMKKAYEEHPAIQRKVDFGLHGRFDIFFEERSLTEFVQDFQEIRAGHYGCLFHHQTLNMILHRLKAPEANVKVSSLG